MSSTNKTSLGLNQWEGADKPVRQDFVNDNVIIDKNLAKLNNDMTSQKTLWSGGLIMHEGQSLTLSEPISLQKTGIVLCWTGYIYENDTIVTYDNNYIFVPKEHVTNRPGAGVGMLLTTQGLGPICGKYVYISDTTIKGHQKNSAVGTSNGITWNSRSWVLRKVLGV